MYSLSKPVSNLHVKHVLDPNSVIFSMFTKEELLKLCVVKIISPLTFDAMGQPLPGGLYDRSMGSLSEKSLNCGTCTKNFTRCPGHFGYIELPLPVVNPLFHKILSTILRLSCLFCFKMQIPSYIKQLMSVYIHLLDGGMVTEAKEIEMIMNEIISDNTAASDIAEERKIRIKKLQKIAKSIGKSEQTKNILNKTTESLRNKVLHDMLKSISLKKCIHCKTAISRITFYKRKMMTNVKKTENSTVGSTVSDIKIISPEVSRVHIRKIWANEKELLQELVPILKRVDCEFPTDICFFDIVPVPPPLCRPVNYVNNDIVEHPQTLVYKAILQDSLILRTIILVVKGTDVEKLSEDSQAVYTLAEGKTTLEKMHHLWQHLQATVDCIMDKDLSLEKSDSQGLKQIIEKKSGIIRMHMMGKRVNFAARSVITPDPNINIDEIGVPEAFAKHLTYPIPVTPWNVEDVRKMVLNGPNKHPGAKMVEFADGTKYNLSTKRQQESILKRLLTPVDTEKQGYKGVTTVYRHLINGDVLLLNRQPTLHRPSIMAHTARILKDEKTIRLNYANCKAYNADFDGDEMNMHFPQTELARSEGYTLVNVSNQYLVPKDGTPLSGLIQDHMVSGVRMSVRGKFFKRHDYHQLIYQALGYKTGKIILLPPAIIKPEILWSGKQILSTVIMNVIPKNREPLNLTATAKISSKAWCNFPSRPWKAGGSPMKNANDMTEAEVIIRRGELLCGVLDKMHYGATPYGLVHCIYELYGGTYATRLLSSFAKLFTCFLQQEGFTLGVHDILVQEKADKERSSIIKDCRKIGHIASALAVDFPPDTPEELLLQQLSIAQATNPKFRTILDRQYKQSLDGYTNEINKVCLPAGLVCKFPDNNLQLMVQSGAKGSTVNTMQISCLLGQIELEGKRPPLMISGKSLPSFIPFDTQPRAGGFIDGRFMTGILPQEFFFHCMAGREGLIDTAVKTSRSGYLQRCLVKHLEGLRVHYDLTVRDSDQSVIQFFYGEDGMDISKVQFLKQSQMNFLADNNKAIVDVETMKSLKEGEDYSKVKKRIKQLKRWKKENGDPLKRSRQNPFLKFSTSVGKKLNKENTYKIDKKTGRSEMSEEICEMWLKATPEIRKSFEDEFLPCPNPTNTDFQPDFYYGSLTDHMESLLAQYKTKSKLDDKLNDTLRLKAMQSLAAAGEPVGLLAAQSIGEPSTQMTLNTFHFAGRGEMNVTLGIPRLREILMMASANIKTPSMEIPFKQVPNMEVIAEDFRKSLTRVTVANVLEKVDVSVKLQTQPYRQHSYKLRFYFLPKDLYQNEFKVSPKTIRRHMTNKFFGHIFSAIKKVSKMAIGSFVNEIVETKKPRTNNKEDVDDDGDGENANEMGNEDDSSDEEPEGGEEDAKLTSKFKSIADAQEPEEEEINTDESNDEERSDNGEEGVKEKRANVQLQDSEEEDSNSSIQTDSGAPNYVYDKKNHSWCDLTFALPMSLRNMDLTAILKQVAAKSVISEVENIKRAITYVKDEKDLMLRTDGINISEMFKNCDLVDVNRLYSNDIHQIAGTYGIEAARKVIVKEVKDVFNVYGITVDPRHLLLIADYMTYNGSFEPLSRRGMECNASPFQQMSFESSLKFLRDASIGGKEDSLSSPSSCLMLGKPCTMGTGCFSLLQKMPTTIT